MVWYMERGQVQGIDLDRWRNSQPAGSQSNSEVGNGSDCLKFN